MTNNINITLNDTRYDLKKGSSISQALDILNINSDKPKLTDFVIALNQTFIPRSQYPNTQLQNNDVIELLSPMAGG
ncbi:MAG: sulfur carrier protein ThiS [Oleispira sp.]|nr:sulfur carrier protein ThiS [Oleispira sp.]MBL4881403.1 sulfur carrier protein ThiS [Oleispira sp.]